MPRAVALVITVLLIDMICQSLVYPVLPSLLQQMQGGSKIEAARTYGFLAAAYALAELLSAPILGQLSDRFGRKPVLLLATVGGSVSFLIAALAPSVAVIFVGYGLAGLTSSMLVVVNSVVADATDPEHRAAAFGWVGAAFGIGFVLGPVVGGLVASMGLRAPFFMAAGLMGLAATVVAVAFRESLPPERRSKRHLRGVWPWATLAPLKQFPLVQALAWTQALNALALQILIGVWVVHATHRYGLDVAQNGWLLAGFGLVMAISQALIVPRVVPKLGNRRSLLFGLGVSSLTYVGYGLSGSLIALVVVMAVGAMGAIDEPAQQALVSEAVSEDQQGTVQGSLATIGSLMGIVGPILGTWLFGFGLPAVPGLPFLVSAALVMGAWGMAFRTLRRFAV
jgi:MFS transporter, DHA1 family, tetracycline resistance protein